MRTSILLFALAVLASAGARAQSKEDKRASLVGLANIAFHETGVAALGGGSAGSPFALQVEKALKAAGIHVADFDDAAQRGIPIYELACTSMETAEAKIAVACTSRLLRPVSLDGTSPPKTYAATWTSPLVVAEFDRDRVSDLPNLTEKLVDEFVADWSAANPKAKPAKGKKK